MERHPLSHHAEAFGEWTEGVELRADLGVITLHGDKLWHRHSGYPGFLLTADGTGGRRHFVGVSCINGAATMSVRVPRCFTAIWETEYAKVRNTSKSVRASHGGSTAGLKE